MYIKCTLKNKTMSNNITKFSAILNVIHSIINNRNDLNFMLYTNISHIHFVVHNII